MVELIPEAIREVGEDVAPEPIPLTIDRARIRYEGTFLRPARLDKATAGGLLSLFLFSPTLQSNLRKLLIEARNNPIQLYRVRLRTPDINNILRDNPIGDNYYRIANGTIFGKRASQLWEVDPDQKISR